MEAIFLFTMSKWMTCGIVSPAQSLSLPWGAEEASGAMRQFLMCVFLPLLLRNGLC